jgi:hypothetical protein
MVEMAMPYEDQKRFMEEMILRFEKAFQRVSRSMDVIDRRVERNTEAVEALTQQIYRHTDESTKELRAQRQALLHILDRLEGNSGPSTAA